MMPADNKKPARRQSLLIAAERRAGAVSRQARRIESQHKLARRQLAAMRLAARTSEPAPGGPASDQPSSNADAAAAERLVERAALAGAWSTGRRPLLDELLSPFTVEEFFHAQNARSHAVLLRGEPARFASLVPWRDLDALLMSGNLDADKLRMVVNGTELPPALHSVTLPGTDGSLRGRFVGKVDGRKVRSLAAEGATLILDEAELHLAAARLLAEAFEMALATRSRVNLYASWRTMRGFETHWDDHDVFVLQVQGEKIWRLLGPTRAWPTRDDSTLDQTPPQAPVWTGKLTAGDLLYIPRGWWHDAHVPTDGDGRGSIHLTCQISELTGKDMLDWLAQSLQSEMPFRRPIPVWAGEEAFADHIARMKALIGTALDRLEAGKIAGELRSRWTERSAPGLGAWIEPWKDPAWPRYRLRLLGRGHATCGEEGDSAWLTANGWTHTVDPSALPMIDALLERDELAVETLKKAGEAGGAAADAVEELLAQWIRRGVLHATAPNDKAAGA